MRRTTDRAKLLGWITVMAPLAAACTGCSSSNSTSPGGNDAAAGGVEAGTSLDAAADAEGGSKTVAITWQILRQPVAGAASSRGDAGADEAGTAEAGADEAGTADAGDGGGRVSGVPPVEGVKVCVYQNSAIPCVMTDANGDFTLAGLAPRTNIAVTLEKSGYYSELLAIGTPSTDTTNNVLPQFISPVIAGFPALPGVALDSQKGSVTLFAAGPDRDAGVSGVSGNGVGSDPGLTMAFMPQSGDGPFFVNSDNTFAPTATSFVALLSQTFNVAPGMYTITFTDPNNNDCEPLNFPFDGNGYAIPNVKHEIQIPVVAGYTTLAGVVCTPNSTIVSTDGG